MKFTLNLSLAILFLISCKTKSIESESVIIKDRFLSLVTDTADNIRAQQDLNDLKLRVKLEQQIGLKDITQGTDSFEIRLWYDFSFANIQELYVLRFRDTFCNLSYHRIYQRSINYHNENRNRAWNPDKNPIVDSSVSKSVLLTQIDYNNLHLDSIWLLKSQSELKFSNRVSFSDCDTYVIEIADKNRFKYFRHHCAMGYYNRTKLPQISTYIDFCNRIINLTRKYRGMLPYDYK